MQIELRSRGKERAEKYTYISGILAIIGILMWLSPVFLPKRKQSSPFCQEEFDRFIRELNDWRPRIRWNAAKCLGEMGTNAIAAIPSLERLLSDPDDWVRGQVEEALRWIRGPSRIG
jgi:HEAT repeat protein